MFFICYPRTKVEARNKSVSCQDGTLLQTDRKGKTKRVISHMTL